MEFPKGSHALLPFGRHCCGFPAQAKFKKGKISAASDPDF
ncbi:hypothetical protein CBNA_1379 [Coxiella burnetii str. Namibia]|nr:hypothetical protein CBNA_1379 [Coxiella burnetii str. Namibia]